MSADYWKFWSSTTISQVGSRFTQFALPLFVYNLTGSAFSLAIATALSFLPTLLFGLILGAGTDRLDRKRLLVYAALAKALVIASTPTLAILESLTLWWVYAAIFLHSRLSALTRPAEFAATLAKLGEPRKPDEGQRLPAGGHLSRSRRGPAARRLAGDARSRLQPPVLRRALVGARGADPGLRKDRP